MMKYQDILDKTVWPYTHVIGSGKLWFALDKTGEKEIGQFEKFSQAVECVIQNRLNYEHIIEADE